MSDKNDSYSKVDRLSTSQRLGAAAVAACFLAAPALSNPVNPVVVNGTAAFNQAGNVLTVSNSNGAVINWDKFSIKAGETTRFAQPSASSSVLNRVLNDPTTIYGTLSSNGRVWLVNPAGILVGPGGRIDTAGFVASTLNISNENFLAGRKLFVNDGNAMGVINQGSITTPSGGSVYLIGSNVSNDGIITTPQGETILAAGQTVSLIDSATPGVKVDITGSEGNATNIGSIAAEAGRIGIAGVIVRNSGNLNASSVVNEGGRIFLKANEDSYVSGDSKISANGSKGGVVEVLGNRVAVMDSASIDVSGTNGGGTILVGGDYQGKNPDVQNATITYFGKDAVLKADATDNGNGGKVIVWADDTTRAYGSISARGGRNGGNGGFIETSGHSYLDVAGVRVSAAASAGLAGNWLLDPGEIQLSSGGTSTPVSPNPFATSTTGNIIYDSDISASLNNGTSVYLQTTSGGGGTGNFYFGPGISISNGTWAGAAPTLTLDAYANISNFSGTYTASGSSGFIVTLKPGGIVTTASGSPLTINGSSGPLSVQVANGKTWDNYDTVNLTGNSQINLWDGATGYATFNNNPGATFNSTSSALKPFVSFTTAGGTINNYGAMSFGTTNIPGYTGTIDPAFNQSGAGSSLTLSGGGSMLFRNVQTVSDTTINLGGTGFEVTENHGGPANFTNVTFGTGGTVYVSGASTVANFSNVTGTGAMSLNVTNGANLTISNYSDLSGALVSLDGSTINMNCDAAFKDLNYVSGSINFTNGVLGLKTPSLFDGIIPAAFNFGTRGGVVSGGSLTVSNTITSSGDLLLASGWDGVFAGLSNPNVSGVAGIAVNAGISATGVLDMRAGSAGVQISNVAVSGGGASQSVTTTGPIAVQASNAGSAGISYTGIGLQTIHGGSITVSSNATGSSNMSAVVASSGNQDLAATAGNILVQAASPAISSYSNDYASITASGNQTIDSGAGDIKVFAGWGGTSDNRALITAGVNQTITNAANILVKADQNGTYASTFNFARLEATAGFQNFTAASGIFVLGGTIGTSNAAIIQAGTSQTISAGGIVTVTGGVGSGNYAQLHGVTSQGITAAGLLVTGGASGTGNYAYVNADTSQTFTLGANDMVLLGGGGSGNWAHVSAQTIQGIGSGGTISVSGGNGAAGSNDAGINALGAQTITGNPAIIVQGGSTGSGNGAYIFSSTGDQTVAAASLTLTAGSFRQQQLCSYRGRP